MEPKSYSRISIIKEDNYTQHSEDIQEIISAPPRWLLRWGILAFFFIIMLIIGVSAFISYPDSVKASLQVHATNPPVPVIAKYSGKLTKVVVSDNQSVVVNEPLAYMTVLQPSQDKERGIITIVSEANGEILFPGVVLDGQYIKAGQELFYINQSNENFFGIINIPEDKIGKVKKGQIVLIKLKSYPFQEYGILRGKIEFISDLPSSNHAFIAKVSISLKDLHGPLKSIKLRVGMLADSEIITDNSSLLYRITKNFSKLL